MKVMVELQQQSWQNFTRALHLLIFNKSFGVTGVCNSATAHKFIELLQSCTIIRI